jgi:restriction system protein
MEFLLGLFCLYCFYCTLFGSRIKRRKMQKQLIKANIQEIDKMSGYEFEEYLYVLFKRLGYSVTRTKKSGDYGADLLLHKDLNRIVVQTKRHSKKVSTRAIQEVVAAKAHYKAQQCWVVTNNYFTTPAIQLANSNNVRLYDREQLAELILKDNKGILL